MDRYRVNQRNYGGEAASFEVACAKVTGPLQLAGSRLVVDVKSSNPLSGQVKSTRFLNL